MKRWVKCIRLLQFEHSRRAHVHVVNFDAQQFQLVLQCQLSKGVLSATLTIYLLKY